MKGWVRDGTVRAVVQRAGRASFVGGKRSDSGGGVPPMKMGKFGSENSEKPVELEHTRAIHDYKYFAGDLADVVM